MTKEEIIKLINDICEKKIQDSTAFRQWRKFDSATDVLSPLTAASNKVGFFNTALQSKQTVTGSRGSNAALASLLTALSAYGLITNSSS